MTEIKVRRWRLNGQTSKPHLFAGDSKSALCGAPKRAAENADRHWEDVSNDAWWEVCWTCRDKQSALLGEKSER